MNARERATAHARAAAHYPAVMFVPSSNQARTRVACKCGEELGTYRTGSAEIVEAYRAHEREEARRDTG